MGDDDEEEDIPLEDLSPRRPWRVKVFDRFLEKHAPNLFSSKIFKVIEFVSAAIDRTSLILGFILFTTGIVTYSGIFRANNIFNGLAHFVKGGIFFWYGLLSLGRWVGAFADLGWAWNVKPSRSQVGEWKASVPSAEFIESFVIFLYGSTNVFLEHLAAWGKEWSAQDFEHVSISIMFFGGGLCGMLVESSNVRRLLNTSVSSWPTHFESYPSETHEIQTPPKQYAVSTNPVPALVILLLGIMMSSHHQDSMTSSMVHKQWGTLLVGFALARMVTYLLSYISPPTSIFPSRPPTEIIASFCLISGGITFMASTKDIMHYMDQAGLMAMFTLTVTVGFTAFLMAYEILVLALKGWAIRKELGKVAY